MYKVVQISSKFALACVSVFVVLFAQTSSAELLQYQLSFELEGGSKIASSGNFEFDTTANLFTAFSVEWNSITFDLTASANDPLFFGSDPSLDCIEGLSNTISPATAFGLLSQNLPGCTNYYWEALELEGTALPYELLTRFNFVAGNTSGLNTVSFGAGGGGLLFTQQHYGSFTAATVPLPGAAFLYLTGLFIFQLSASGFRKSNAL